MSTKTRAAAALSLLACSPAFADFHLSDIEFGATYPVSMTLGHLGGGAFPIVQSDAANPNNYTGGQLLSHDQILSWGSGLGETIGFLLGYDVTPSTRVELDCFCNLFANTATVAYGGMARAAYPGVDAQGNLYQAGTVVPYGAIADVTVTSVSLSGMHYWRIPTHVWPQGWQSNVILNHLTWFGRAGVTMSHTHIDTLIGVGVPGCSTQGFCGNGFSHDSTSVSPTLGVGIALHWFRRAKATLEFRRVFNFGDSATTGRYYTQWVGIGFSMSLREYRQNNGG